MPHPSSLSETFRGAPEVGFTFAFTPATATTTLVAAAIPGSVTTDASAPRRRSSRSNRKTETEESHEPHRPPDTA